MSIIDALTDSDPRLPAMPEQSPDELRRDAEEPATVASVRSAVEHHARTCSAPHKMYRWGKIACVLIGMGLALQVVVALAGRAMLRETVRTVLREEMSHVAAVKQPEWSPLVPSAFAKGSSK